MERNGVWYTYLLKVIYFRNVPTEVIEMSFFRALKYGSISCQLQIEPNGIKDNFNSF